MAYYEDDYDYDIFGNDEETIALTKRGKPRKRKPKEPRIYFTQDTEDAIVEYLGPNYPLYFNNINEILNIMRVKNIIRATGRNFLVKQLFRAEVGFVLFLVILITTHFSPLADAGMVNPNVHEFELILFLVVSRNLAY